MSKTQNKKLVLAALAGIALAATAPTAAAGQDVKSEVKCYGINGCKAQAGCSVTSDDVIAVKALLGVRAFNQQFGKTKTHSCAADASCGAKRHILNWTNISADECQALGGIVVEEVDGKKVAKKM